MTIVAALLGLAAKESDRSLALIALNVLAALTGLDAYYLALEREYRRLYDHVREGMAVDWSLCAPVGAGDLAAARRPALSVLE